MALEQNLERGWLWYTVSPANFLDWQKEGEVFESIAAYSLYSDTGYNLTGGSTPERIVTSAVTADFFRVFKEPALMGRTFLEGEDQPGQDQVVVLSHGLWQRRFGADPGVLGTNVLMDGIPHTVIGVMGADFSFPESTELWLPLVFDAKERANRTIRSLFTVARLQPELGLEKARSQMETVAQRLQTQYPESNAGFGIVLHGLHDRLVGGVKPALAVLLGAVGFLLLIACANVANLVLVQSSSRSRELALRQAFGATRFRLVHLLLTESLMLGISGGLGGLVLAWGVTKILLAVSPADIPRLGEVKVGATVLAFTLAVAVLTALVSSLAPLFNLGKIQLAETLSAGGRGSSASRGSNRVRNGIVATQVAFALLLLAGAGLTAQSFLKLQQQEVGFDAKGLLSMQLALPATKYPDPSSQGLFYSELLARVEAQPGVGRAAVTSWLPFASVPVDWDFHVAGRPPRKLDDAVVAGFRAVSPGYFEAMSIPLLSGRTLVPGDRQDAPRVVVINETMARRYWSGESPVGERIVLGDLVKHMLPGLPLEAEVGGIVGDVKQTGLSLPAEPEMYVSNTQYSWPSMFLVVRSRGNPEDLAASVRNQIRTMDPGQPSYDVRTVAQRVRDSVADSRLTVLLLGVFALLALVLASIGIYGVISFSMSQRAREIGTRMALGADRQTILLWVLKRSLLPTLVGLGCGLAAALVLGRVMRGLLFEISPGDPLTLAVVAVILLSVSASAALVPALRTSRLDPLRALRED